MSMYTINTHRYWENHNHFEKERSDPYMAQHMLRESSKGIAEKKEQIQHNMNDRIN